MPRIEAPRFPYRTLRGVQDVGFLWILNLSFRCGEAARNLIPEKQGTFHWKATSRAMHEIPLSTDILYGEEGLSLGMTDFFGT